MLAPSPFSTTTWPAAGDVPSLLQIVTDQAEVVASNEALLHAYQVNLNAAQNPVAGTPATANGAITTGATTSIAVSGTIGTIVAGASVGGTTNATAPTVLGQISGTTGSDGTYLLSAPVTFAVVTGLTFTPPSGAFPGTWPVPRDVNTLDLLVQQQTAIIRTQTALIQHCQDVLNTSQVAAPATGP